MKIPTKISTASSIIGKEICINSSTSLKFISLKSKVLLRGFFYWQLHFSSVNIFALFHQFHPCPPPPAFKPHPVDITPTLQHCPRREPCEEKKWQLYFGTFIKIKCLKILAYGQIELDLKCIIVIPKICKKVDDEEGWWFFQAQGISRQAPWWSPVVDFSTRSTDFVNAYRLSRWAQHLMVAWRG